MLSDKLAILMTHHLTKEASGQEEEEELMDLLTAAPELQYLIELLSDYWHQDNDDESFTNDNADERFRYIVDQAQEPDDPPQFSSFSVGCELPFQKVKPKI